MAEQQPKWGVTDVTIRYVSGDSTYEVSLDPDRIDILVFNWNRYKQIAAMIGSPADKARQVLPDGRSANGKPADEVAREMGLKGPPRRVGPREEGTAYQPICYHKVECVWYCQDETHDHNDS